MLNLSNRFEKKKPCLSIIYLVRLRIAKVKFLVQCQEISTCLIEWSQLIPEILPDEVIRIRIEKDLEQGFDYRKITVEGLE